MKLKENGKFVLLLLVSIFITCCTVKNKSQKENNVKEKEEPTVANLTFNEWWKYKYQNIPSNIEGEYIQGEYAGRYKKRPYKFEYISKYDIDTLLKYYKIFMIANWNKEISSVKEHKYDKLAEKTNMHKDFYSELSTYMAFYYLDYLDTITKEWFAEHKELGIEPYYYSSIRNTAYVDTLTFDCDIVVNLPPDADDFDVEINKIIMYLKENLPDMIQGFRVLDVKYVNTVSGTSNFLNYGYIWRRKDNSLLKLNKSGHNYNDWGNDSWNDGKKIESYYNIN